MPSRYWKAFFIRFSSFFKKTIEKTSKLLIISPVLGMFRFRQAGTTSEGSGVASLKADTITSANKPVMFRAPAMMACAA